MLEYSIGEVARLTGVSQRMLRHYDEIGLLDAPPAAAVEQLKAQEGVLRAGIERMQGQLAVVDKTRRLKEMGINLEPRDMFEVFGEHDPTEYADEAKDRWGETDAYAESKRRTSSYTKEDWLRVQAEGEAVEAAFAAALAADLPSDSVEAKAAAEQHRLQIDRNYYPCSYEMQTGLAEMYLADARFMKHYEDRAVGLAQYVHDAIYANAVDHL